MFAYPETITVWNPATNDGFGVTWAVPVRYPARIAYVQQRFTDKNGDTAVSTGVCYSEGALLGIDSVVLFSASEAAEPPPGANDVRALSQTPSGSGPIKKAWFS